MSIDITDSSYERGTLPARSAILGRSLNLTIDMTEGEIFEIRAGAGPSPPTLAVDGTVPTNKVWSVVVSITILETDE